MLKKVIPGLIFALTLPTFQASAAQKDDYSTKITRVYINSSDELLMKIDSSDEWMLIGKVGNARAEMMYSTALAAKLSSAEVWVRYWDHTGSKYSDVRIISVQG
ncbi:hypothetical protein [Pseudoalteromonas sp. Of7M-16]|uniref:hypothetical protein n=1 Tax=Pseudoalteromonas sp. Of7M-16 TaxID=2917756 RepID=UPI001EF5EBD5|nr:hypothetical protein [Pseudoalteromonas sp. Of7M-16]MCG7550818.1 hypothetical protein [Pseudoalteromonas sp. Of7M-16]